jgi:hypothetical protein
MHGAEDQTGAYRLTDVDHPSDPTTHTHNYQRWPVLTSCNHHTPNQPQEYRIRGEYPRVRFFSIQTYDYPAEQPVGHIADFEIQPLPGSVNPFNDFSRGPLDTGQYEVYVTARGDKGACGVGLGLWGLIRVRVGLFESALRGGAGARKTRVRACLNACFAQHAHTRRLPQRDPRLSCSGAWTAP